MLILERLPQSRAVFHLQATCVRLNVFDSVFLVIIFLQSQRAGHTNTIFLQTVSVYYVISAKVDAEEKALHFAYLRHDDKGKKHASLVQNAFNLPEETDIESAQEWCKNVLELAYDGGCFIGIIFMTI